MRKTLGTVAVCFLLIALASAQDSAKKQIRVGVAMPVNRSRLVFAPMWERDSLIHSIELIEKDSVDLESQVVAIPLKSSSYKDAARECKDKCDFLIFVTVRETGPGTTVDPSGGMAVNPVVIGPRMGNGAALTAEPALIQYDIQRASGSVKKVADGAMTIMQTDDPQNSVRLTLDQIAPQMVKQVKKQRMEIN